jgi:hypothetical protein
MRPHLLFRGATFQSCGLGESREVPLLAKTSSDGLFHFDDQLLIYRVGGLRPATTKDSLLQGAGDVKFRRDFGDS